MAHYIDADLLRAELDKRYTEYRAKMKTDDFTYYEGMADALDHFEQYIDTLPEQPVDGLEEEMDEMWLEYCEDVDYLVYASIARHFAEWGAEHARKEDK